jgi:hypothetical protein
VKPRTNILILRDSGFKALGFPNQKQLNNYFYDDCERINKYALLENKPFEWREEMHASMIVKWNFKKLNWFQRHFTLS